MEYLNPLLESALLGEIAPYTVSGYRLFREVVEIDGAISARLKGLFVAVAATNKGYGELARREVERASRLGLTLKEAAAGLILLSSLRGEGAALSFQATLGAAYPSRQAPGEPSRSALPVEPGEAENNFRQYFGAVPAPLARLLELSPKGADGYYLMRKGTIECNSLESKYAELLLVTVLASDYSPMIATHIKAARTAGATDHELAEAILCAVPAAGIAAWVGAAAHL